MIGKVGTFDIKRIRIIQLESFYFMTISIWLLLMFILEDEEKIFSMGFYWHQTNKNQEQMKLMKPYLSNSNLKNQQIKREHQQKKVKWMKYERKNDNEQRKNTREKEG